MSELSKAVAQYLERHAEPEAALATGIEGSYDHVLVVPALFESIDLLAGFRRAAREGGLPLCVLVVNATDDAGDEVHEANRELLGGLASGAESGPGLWLAERDELDVLVVDRASEGRRLPRGEGVGLARKIGCDVALALCVAGTVHSAMIHCTDADAELPEDYFDVADASLGAKALSYPFWHEPCGDAATDRAHALYELLLRYYVLGLAHAGSPYAFHTVGSTLAFATSAYAQVRGVPRREAGEDFYLINKVAKLGAVVRPPIDPIRIHARSSDRVPFGTGPSVRRIADTLARDANVLTYDPTCFALLGTWVELIERFAAEPDVPRLETELDALPNPLAAALETLDAHGALVEAAAATGAGASLRRRLHTWFDGFRTLKLIHAIRDAGHPKVAWGEALASAPFFDLGCDPAALEDARVAALALEAEVLARPVGLG